MQDHLPEDMIYYMYLWPYRMSFTVPTSVLIECINIW